MNQLQDLKRPANSGKADRLVIFLHGYGSSASGLMGLAPMLAPVLPTTAFRAPDAPLVPAGYPQGRYWFPVPWFDGSSLEAGEEGLRLAVSLLNDYLDRVAEETGIPASRTTLIGFSQGTMLSLFVGPRRQEQLAGIVGFSGYLFEPQRLAAEIVTRPPVLLVHGELDDLVPPRSMPAAAKVLRELGVEVTTHLSPNTPHSIAQDGLQACADFLASL